MNWSLIKIRRYIALLAPLVIVIPVILQVGTVGKGYSYKPSIVLPDATPDITSELEIDAESVQLALLPDNVQLPGPFPLQPLRALLANRSGINMRSADWRFFHDELSAYKIDLKSDPAEETNIELAASAINGTIIQPFDTFSFNAAVGERSEDRGFRPGLMFSNGEVISGTGGGVCLVSTALYNCALEAGCKILERTHHSGPVRYADPGLDSAVVYGMLDLRFKNDSLTPVMIRAKVEDDHLIVSLNGRKRPGYDVEVVKDAYKELPYKIFEKEDPTVPDGELKVKAPARTGYEVTIVRIIKQDGKVAKREIISEDYMPARNKIVLAPPKPKEEQVNEPKTAHANEPVESKLTVSTPPQIEAEQKAPEEPSNPSAKAEKQLEVKLEMDKAASRTKTQL